MSKVFDQILYLTPREATSFLLVSDKTLQRWAEEGEASVLVSGSSERTNIRVKIEMKRTLTGYRYFDATEILRLAEQLNLKKAVTDISNMIRTFKGAS